MPQEIGNVFFRPRRISREIFSLTPRTSRRPRPTIEKCQPAYPSGILSGESIKTQHTILPYKAEAWCAFINRIFPVYRDMILLRQQTSAVADFSSFLPLPNQSTVTTFRTLVVPVCPRGAPAVMTTLSPHVTTSAFLAQSMAWRYRLSALLWCRASTGITPHDSAS